MSNKKLMVLGIVAALMLLWAVIQSRIANRPRAASAGQSYLLQGLDPADIYTIVIGKDEDAVTLQRLNNVFVVANKDNYPVKASEINNLITDCLEIKTSEFITDNPVNHDSLEVTEEKASTVVKFLREDSSVITGIIAGKQRELGEGTYVRLATEDNVYLADSIPWISTSAISYVEQQLISVQRDNIDSVTVVSADGEFTLRMSEDGADCVLENIPVGKQADSSVCNTVFTALTSLRFDDVARDFGDLTFKRQYICRLKDSTIYTLNIATDADDTYVTCTAVFGDATPVPPSSETESDEELKKKEAKLLAWEQANTFTIKHKGWIYKVSSYTADNLIKELSELIKDEEESEEQQAEDTNIVTPESIMVPQTGVSLPEAESSEEPTEGYNSISSED